jgi:hypothetical protein
MSSCSSVLYKLWLAGGTGVVTGSPPNLVVLSNLNKQFGNNKVPNQIILKGLSHEIDTGYRWYE